MSTVFIVKYFVIWKSFLKKRRRKAGRQYNLHIYRTLYLINLAWTGFQRKLYLNIVDMKNPRTRAVSGYSPFSSRWAQNVPLLHQPSIFSQKCADIVHKNAAIHKNHGVLSVSYMLFLQFSAQFNQNLPALLASSIETATATVAPTIGLFPIPIRPIIST